MFIRIKPRLLLVVIAITLMQFQLVSAQVECRNLCEGTAIFIENGALRGAKVALKPIGDAWEILEVAELTKEAIEQSGEPFSDTRKEGIYSLKMEGYDILFNFNPVDGAKKLNLLARISQKKLIDAVQAPIREQLMPGSPERFYSKNTVRTFDLVTSFDVNLRRMKVTAPYRDHLFLYINNFDVNYPEFNELSVNRFYGTELGQFMGHNYYFMVYIKLGDFIIPPQRIEWSDFASGNEIILNLEEYGAHFDEIMQSEISVVADLRERYIFADNSVSTLIYQSETPTYLDPPVVSSKSFDNSIELTIEEDPRAEETIVYRSTNENTEPEPITLNCSNNVCTDINVIGGVKYSYYAISTKGTYSSLKSNVVSGVPTTEYKMDNVIYDPVVSAYSNRIVKGRLLNVYTNLPIEPNGVEVFLSIPDLGIVYPPVPIDVNGEFEINYKASTEIGSHDIRIEAKIGNNSIFREYEQEVVEADNKGRNLTIQYVNINSNVIDTSGSISGSIGIVNDGIYSENNGRLIFKLYSKNGVVGETSTINFSLSQGATTNQNFSIPLSEGTIPGDYQLKIEFREFR